MEGENPYAAPDVDVDPDHDSSPAAEIRRAHLETEASLKTLGLLFKIVGTLSVGWSAVNASTLLPAFTPEGVEPKVLNGILAIVALVLVLAYWVLGAELRELAPGSRIPCLALSLLCLLNLPVGTVLSVYALTLLTSARAKTVLSADYAEVIKATPQVRTSRLGGAWVLLVLCMLAAGAYASFALFVRP